MIINQWLAAAHRHDAVGDNARRMRDVFRDWGCTSEIYALTVDDDLAHEVQPFTATGARDGDVTILHFAVPSPMTRAFATLPGVRVLHYHNVTPAHFFAPYDTGISRFVSKGREELASLAGHTDLALGVSAYNRAELDALGFASTGVLPIVVDPDRLRRARRVPALESMLTDGFANILFVGRIAPNKRIEDHIRLAEHYKRYIDLRYRFIFVGNDQAVPRYAATIRALIAEYRMLPERFWFTGPVPDEELATYYRCAHAYVSLSEHEGFCVPLMEAMAMDVPVLAYGAAAVPDTMGGAGVCFTPKDLEWAAEFLGALVYDQPLRDQILPGQRRRVADFGRDRLEPRLRSLLSEFM